MGRGLSLGVIGHTVKSMFYCNISKESLAQVHGFICVMFETIVLLLILNVCAYLRKNKCENVALNSN